MEAYGSDKPDTRYPSLVLGNGAMQESHKDVLSGSSPVEVDD
jgi:aspartyl-tRNA synthetase